jgi:riboflavin synthase
VALDGVSLTVADLRDDAFSVALIPTTLKRTTLGQLRVTDLVNVESDMIVRAVVHRMGHTSHNDGLSMSLLRESGFA